MDPLGFAIFAALVVTQPQLFGHGWNALKRGWGEAQSRFPGANRVLTMWTSEQFLKLSVLLAIAEYFWYSYLPESAADLGYSKYFWALCFGQLVWAGLNMFLSWGRNVTVLASDTSIEPDPDDIGDTIDVKDVITVWRHRFGWVNWLQSLPVIGFILRAHPIIWLALVAGGWLLQGASLEYYAIRYIADYSDQQWLIVYGWFSKLVYGVIALTASGIIGWFVTKSTRSGESISTILAKLIVSIPIGIEYDKNALAAIGGPIDILDEDRLAKGISWMLTVLFVPLLVFDIAVFLWPDPIIAGAILVGIVVTGLLEFVFGRMAPGTNDEALADRTRRMRVIFKMGPVVAIILFVLGNFIAETLTGWNLTVEVGNFWYGVSYYTHVSFLFNLFITTPFLLLAVKYLRKAQTSVATSVKEADAEGDVKGWHGGPKRYVSWALLLGWAGAASAAFIVAFSAFASACGGERVRRDMALDQESVTFVNVMVNKDPIQVTADEPWLLAAPKNGRVRIEFDTLERAHGAVEFDSPKAARNAGMPSYVTVISERTSERCLVKSGDSYKVESTKNSDEPECAFRLYHHVAEFEVAPDFYGSYRVVMRNAQVTPPNPVAKTSGKTDPEFGRVATSAPFTLDAPPEPSGYWARFCAWWSDLWDWDDDDDDPPRTVVVHHYQPPSRPAAAPRGTGCKVKPLRVVPSLRDEVAAAGRR